jgi:hypothetical protein
MRIRVKMPQANPAMRHFNASYVWTIKRRFVINGALDRTGFAAIR